jgi:hypothetical protein
MVLFSSQSSKLFKMFLEFHPTITQKFKKFQNYY